MIIGLVLYVVREIAISKSLCREVRKILVMELRYYDISKCVSIRCDFSPNIDIHIVFGYFIEKYYALYVLLCSSWWRHQMETLSVLLAFCAKILRSVTRSFDVFFDLCLNPQLSKQWKRWWFDTPSHALWRHCNVYFPILWKMLEYREIYIWRLRFQTMMQWRHISVTTSQITGNATVCSTVYTG